jgi:hypothetical protein
VTLTFVTTPDISYGVTSDWKIVHGDHSADLTGATWPPAVTAAAA